MMDIEKIPSILQTKAANSLKNFAMTTHRLFPAVQHLLAVSDYACRQINCLEALLQEDDCQSALMDQDYQQRLALIPLDLPPSLFASSLRHFRHQHFLRLLLRELAEMASIEQTMLAWSHCADAIILHTIRYCELQLMANFGQPWTSCGEKSILHIIAMGKLGGLELNFSSDIDLIFVYSGSGDTDGKESITNEQFFTKVVRQFVQLLQTVTADGFVFRVDLRLRPNGDSGPLVSSQVSLENYYQEQGRDWERYAMVKARLIGGSQSKPTWFIQLITSFVYRRYVDFSVIESLRSMKSMIEREIHLNTILDDIKRGAGGIREIEFVIQCFQLIYGGRIPSLQQNNAMLAMIALKKQQLLDDIGLIQQAYLFLRQLENTLQMQNDQQTHILPQDEFKQLQLAVAMGFGCWSDLLNRLHYFQQVVRHIFRAILSQEGEYEDKNRLLDHQLVSLWQGQLEPLMVSYLLKDMGYQDSERCYQMIHGFRQAPRCRRIPQVARLRLERFMVLLLKELTQFACADYLLLQVLNLLEQIVGRSAYLALLTEHPSVLHELLHCFSCSPYITSLIVEQPFLLEILIDQPNTWRPLSRQQLAMLLQGHLTDSSKQGDQNDILRQFKLTTLLLAARAELYGHCDALCIGKFLSDVALVIVQAVFEKACQELEERFPEIHRVKANFMIIAYGKLGSREMNYDSDLDLVFLHTMSIQHERLVIRLTQKILHLLTARSQMGVLYLVDTRLRPSGSSGLLVSHLDLFVDYQMNNAWTWEHQALLRARPLLAKAKWRTVFYHLKKRILLFRREQPSLLRDVLSMREKIGYISKKHSIKYSKGGLLDLEFLVQFLMLAYPNQTMAYITNTLVQLQKLNFYNHINSIQLAQLKNAYHCFHEALHQDLIKSSNHLLCDRESLDVQVIVNQLINSFQ